MAEPFIVETREETVQRLIDYHRSTPTEITDYNPGSETRNLLETMGYTVNDLMQLRDDLLKQGYPHTAEGDYLDMVGVIVDCKRKPAVQATGSVVVSVEESKSYDIDIPVGTVLFCSRNPDLEFQTTTDIIFPAGNTSILINNVLAVNGGTDGNVAPGMIDSFSEPIEDLTVTNTAQFEKGSEVESDLLFKPRIMGATKGLKTGSINWYRSIAGAVVGVHDVGVPIRAFGEVYLLVNGVTKPTPDGVVNAVRDVFLDENNAIPGLEVTVGKSLYNTVNISSSVSLKPGYVWAAVKSELEKDIACYFNGGVTSYGTEYPGLYHAENVIRSAIQLIIANNPGVLDYNLTAPSINVEISDEFAAKLGTVTLTQTV